MAWPSAYDPLGPALSVVRQSGAGEDALLRVQRWWSIRLATTIWAIRLAVAIPLSTTLAGHGGCTSAWHLAFHAEAAERTPASFVLVDLKAEELSHLCQLLTLSTDLQQTFRCLKMQQR
jgi:hypothetical protein